MRALTLLLAAMIATSTAEAAAAKNIFLEDASGNSYVFRGVKKLKPGASTPLSGAFLFAGGIDTTNPMFGTAIMTAGGTIKASVFIHTFATGNITQAMTLDAEWNGTGDEDANGDFANDGMAIVYARVDCKTVVFPE